jgi:transcriptional regulator with XRE-family HTH domain
MQETDFSWKEVGQRIREIRLAQGRSQDDIAAATGLSQPGLFRIEVGATNPQLDTLARVASALGTSVRQLLCGCEQSPAAASEAWARRAARVEASGDPAAVTALLNGLEAAEAILERSIEVGLRRPGAQKLRLRVPGPVPKIDPNIPVVRKLGKHSSELPEPALMQFLATLKPSDRSVAALKALGLTMNLSADAQGREPTTASNRSTKAQSKFVKPPRRAAGAKHDANGI